MNKPHAIVRQNKYTSISKLFHYTLPCYLYLKQCFNTVKLQIIDQKMRDTNHKLCFVLDFEMHLKTELLHQL